MTSHPSTSRDASSQPSPSRTSVPPATDANASGHADPSWYAAADVPAYGPLSADAAADVCVVGAGIAGLTTAYLLAKAGRAVVVVDEKPVAGGESGRTSAHLASAIDDRFVEIERLHGEAGSRVQYESHAAAIDLIEQISRDEDIACDFRRLDAYLFLGGTDTPDTLDKELEAAKRAGFPDVERLAEASVKGITTGPCLRFGRQARFHPVKYLAGLARRLAAMGVSIHCGSRVKDVAGGESVRVDVQGGRTITAKAAVCATNVPAPVNNWPGIYTKVAPYRTYMVALNVPKGSVSDALYWDTPDPYHYVRLDPADADASDGGAGGGGAAAHDLLLVGGEDHKTGQHTSADEQEAHFRNLEAWTRQKFHSAGAVAYRWSGQVYEPDDYVAFIGRAPTSGMDNVYVITGDSGMGMTHGTLGARLVADLILGKPNPWAALYDPARKTLKAGTEWLKENLNAAAQYADYVTPGEVSNTDDIAPGHGAVVRRGLKKVACHRDAHGKLHECSAVCTHLMGVVRWNDVEKSWDCPVHGSRFDAKGKVLTGPAVDDLAKLDG
jgi:glycine/D-amino acid oxidase-like deaminating enzyme/nitrite reductase/ring-hydroxylating ferredoxin subunit